MVLPSAQSAPNPATALLRGIVVALCAVIGSWRIAPAQGVVAYRRIAVALQRIERMLRRLRAGKQVECRRNITTRARPAARKAGVRLPRTFGWLIAAGTHQAAHVRLQVEDLLATPEMVTLLEISPQARQILRPFCRALAIALPWTATPPRIAKPRAPRPKPSPSRIKLPRGVISWMRREKALEKAIRRKHELVAQMFRKVN